MKPNLTQVILNRSNQFLNLIMMVAVSPQLTVHSVLVMTFLVVTYWDCASVDIGEKLSREQDTTDILWSVSVQCWTHLCCTLSLYTCIPSTQANQRRTFNLHSPPINQSIDLMIIYYRHKYYCYCHHIIISRLESFSLLTDRKSSNKD